MFNIQTGERLNNQGGTTMAMGSAQKEFGVIQLGPCIETIIAAGYHHATNFGQGMTAEDYRRLWPTEVLSPMFQAQDDFGCVLLVDRTIAMSELLRLGGSETQYINLQDWKDGMEAPVDPETQLQYARYVAFTQLGERRFGHSADEYWKTCATFEIGLTKFEGLHVAVQYRSYLEKHGVILLGSRTQNQEVLYLLRGATNKTVIMAGPSYLVRENYGTATRSTEVRPVW